MYENMYEIVLFGYLFYLRFANHESAATAIVKCNGQEMDGCYIKVLLKFTLFHLFEYNFLFNY